MGSMYGIFTYRFAILQWSSFVGKYASTTEHMGYIPGPSKYQCNYPHSIDMFDGQAPLFGCIVDYSWL